MIEDLSNILHIDLSEKQFYQERRENLFKSRLGGTGVATKLLSEECPKGIDPTSPENPIIFSVGPLTGSFPLSSKTVAMFKSPHTGNLGESHCGGRSATSIRLSGHGAVVIKGSSEIPIYLAIHDDKVHFRDASSLWGMDSSYTVGRIIRENEPRSGLRSIMRIGKAGEKGVTYAGVVTETYRHFGRLGLGAVFGSKNLKGLVISGKSSLPVANEKKYRDIYEEIYDKAVSSPAMKKYHDLGTSKNVLPLNEMGALPTKNLNEAKFTEAEEISGEYFADEFLGRRLACSHCPVGCIHIAAFREPYEDEQYFYKTSMISYDYEPIYALCPMLGGTNKKGFFRLLDKIEALGMDAISTGVSLAWATEAQKKGLITQDETCGLELDWGKYTSYRKAVELIVEQPNNFYKYLAGGVERAATKYGGKEFALSLGGNEMAGYHTGHAYYIGHLIGARHGHLDNAGYSLDQDTLGEGLGPEETVDRLVEEEQWRQVLSSLVVCFFARGIYDQEVVTKALNSVGFEMDENDLDRVGRKIYKEKFNYKLREGFSLEEKSVPNRIFNTPSPKGEIGEDYIDEALEYFEKKILGK